MSRVRNADQFLNEFRSARQNYEKNVKRNIERAFASYAGERLSQDALINQQTDDLLETHIRTYFVDILLGALNWRLDSNLIPEAAIASESRGTRRFLDYLGIEKNTDKPLLVVETKRPNSLPPAIKKSIRHDNDFSSVICAGLGGEELVGEWNDWLNTLRDYVRSVRRRVNYAPERVVLTNGDWLILFTDPVDAFLSDDGPTLEKILSWQNRDDLERNYVEIFRYLDYYAVIKEIPAFSIGEIPFYVGTDDVDRIMHGLRLIYFEEPEFDGGASPVIKVLPVLFLRSRQGVWFCVESPSQRSAQRVPYNEDALSEHLDNVRASAINLLQEVNFALNIRLTASGLSEHFRNEENLEELAGVREISNSRHFQTYLVITGNNTHYLLPESTVPGCPHHNWIESKKAGVECNLGLIFQPSTRNPRSYFIHLQEHHCANGIVTRAKAQQIMSKAQSNCGPRSGKEGQAFCEIARFEERLCCRTCVFEEVCTKAVTIQAHCSGQRA